MRNNFYIIIILVFGLNITVNAQRQGNIWYFGNYAGIDFNSGSPVALTNSSMRAIEGCASISDTTGNILFYTNGDTVWNKSHAVMPNGTGLFGGFSSTQGSLIVPFPSNPDNYYIFTTDGGDIPYNGTKGLRYSVVDMTLNSGLGDITIKNDSLFARVTEKLTAVKHSNGTDVWVIAHQLDSARFVAYLVTSSGVSSTPVVSNIGQTYIWYSSSIGQLKASPDGSKIAAAEFSSYPSAEVFQFDNSTGILSNAIQLTIPSTSYTYGVDFSPSGNKVYFASDDTPKTIYQFDLSVWSSISINASKLLIGTTSSSRMCGMQIGPDGKIYVAHNNWSLGGTYLGVINNPELTGTSCNYVDNGFYLNGKSCNFGLPAFVQSYFLTPLITTNISTASSLNSNQFFPNPFKNEAILRVPNTQEKVIFILYNSSGQIIMSIDNITNGEVVIDRKELKSGIYYFTLKTKDKLISTGKLIAD